MSGREPMSPELTAAFQERYFLTNAADARECGFALICAECGCGIADESDTHESWCVYYVDARAVGDTE